MEPEVHIIERYFQLVKRAFTMTNIKCEGGKEIDLLAVDPREGRRWHVESRVSTTFPLRMEATYTKDGKCHRNGLDWFKENKFEHPSIVKKIEELFGCLDYEKVLVVYTTEVGYDPSWINTAYRRFGIQVWFIMDIIETLKEQIKVVGARDDVLRLIELISKTERDREKIFKKITNQVVKSIDTYLRCQ